MPKIFGLFVIKRRLGMTEAIKFHFVSLIAAARLTRCETPPWLTVVFSSAFAIS